MGMKVVSELLPGVKLLESPAFGDVRGEFVKTFHAVVFEGAGIPFTSRESFYSSSRRGVIRGMHFQLPPHAHNKLVYCVTGRVLDVVVDLRRTSPTFKRVAMAELSRVNRRQMYVPIGVAHGFMALEDDSILVYNTDTVHAPAHDAGVRWNTLDFDWGVTDAIVSARDAGFPTLEEFHSPF